MKHRKGIIRIQQSTGFQRKAWAVVPTHMRMTAISEALEEMQSPGFYPTLEKEGGLEEDPQISIL
jgi:hypothetical protein